MRISKTPSRTEVIELARRVGELASKVSPDDKAKFDKLNGE